MKHIYILSGLLLLGACAGADDAKPVSTNSRYLEVRASNTQLTSMSQTVTNRSEMVAYAKSVGLLTDDATAVQALTDNRYANAGHSNNADSRDKIPVFNNQYNVVKNAFEKMYAIYTDGFEGLDLKDIKNAYIISGGDINDYVWDATLSDDDKSAIAQQIKTAVETDGLLDRFFDKDDEKYMITDRAQDLSDIDFKSASGTDVFSFTLDEYGEITGIIIDGDEYVRRNRGTVFVRTVETEEQTDTITASIIGYGLKEGLKLKYTDFGMINKQTSRDYKDETLADITVDKALDVYAGGYSLKNVDRQTVAALNSDMDFSGVAAGVVTGQDGTQQRIAADAKLNFKAGTETLDMNFSGGSLLAPSDMKWYHVSITNDGTDSTITFVPKADINENYQLTGIGASGTTFDNYNGAVINYYGDNDAPSEFSGTAKYEDYIENGVKMDVAFGGVLDKPAAKE